MKKEVQEYDEDGGKRTFANEDRKDSVRWEDIERTDNGLSKDEDDDSKMISDE